MIGGRAHVWSGGATVSIARIRPATAADGIAQALRPVSPTSKSSRALHAGTRSAWRSFRRDPWCSQLMIRSVQGDGDHLRVRHRHAHRWNFKLCLTLLKLHIPQARRDDARAASHGFAALARHCVWRSSPQGLRSRFQVACAHRGACRPGHAVARFPPR